MQCASGYILEALITYNPISSLALVVVWVICTDYLFALYHSECVSRKMIKDHIPVGPHFFPCTFYSQGIIYYVCIDLLLYFLFN